MKVGIPLILSIILAMAIIFLINIPFGYWRANVRKFSLGWFVAIHGPVPLVVFLRNHLEFPWEGIVLICLLGAFFLGQFCGKKLSLYLRKFGPVTSFLFSDLMGQTWFIIIGK